MGTTGRLTPGRIDAESIVVPDQADPSSEERYGPDTVAALREALEQLKPTHRRCVRLRYVENRSYTEIARLMGVSVGTVGTYLHRARNGLKRILR